MSSARKQWTSRYGGTLEETDRGSTHSRPIDEPREALLRATDELTADFETAMRRKYGDIVVGVFGIPEAADTRLEPREYAA